MKQITLCLLAGGLLLWGVPKAVESLRAPKAENPATTATGEPAKPPEGPGATLLPKVKELQKQLEGFAEPNKSKGK